MSVTFGRKLIIALWGGAGAGAGLVVWYAIASMTHWGATQWVGFGVAVVFGIFFSKLEHLVHKMLHDEPPHDAPRPDPKRKRKRAVAGAIVGLLLGLTFAVLHEMIHGVLYKQMASFFWLLGVGMLTSGVVTFFWVRGAQEGSSRAAIYGALSGAIVGFGILMLAILVLRGDLTVVPGMPSRAELEVQAMELQVVHPREILAFAGGVLASTVTVMGLNAFTWGLSGYAGGLVVDRKWAKKRPSLKMMLLIIVGVLGAGMISWLFSNVPFSDVFLHLLMDVFRTGGWLLALLLCPGADTLFLAAKKSTASLWGFYTLCIFLVVGLGGGLAVRFWPHPVGEVKQFSLGALPAGTAAFSADGKFAVTGGGGGLLRAGSNIQTWDLEQGKLIGAFEGVTDPVRAVAVLPVGEKIFVGSAGGMMRLTSSSLVRPTATLGGLLTPRPTTEFVVRIWDAEKKEVVRTLSGHTDVVNALAFSYTAPQLATGASDKTVRVWNWETGVELLRFERHTGGVTGVAFSPLGDYIVSCSYDGTVKLFVAEGEVWSFGGHEGAVNAVAASRLGFVVTGGADGTVRVLEVKDGKEVEKFQKHEKAVLCVAVSYHGKVIASGGADGFVRVWSPNGEQAAFEVRGHSIQAIAFSGDGRRLFTLSSDKIIRTWQLPRKLWAE
jgi:WD40 repeat protein